MLPLSDFELRGREVTLRPLRSDDAAALAAASAESREHYLYNWVPDGAEEAQRYVDAALAQRARADRYPFAIVWRGRVVAPPATRSTRPGAGRWVPPCSASIGRTRWRLATPGWPRPRSGPA